MEKFINGNLLLGNSEVVRAFDAQAIEEERDRLKAELAAAKEKIRDLEWKYTDHLKRRDDKGRRSSTRT